MTNFQEQMNKMFDVKAIQDNMAKFYDVEAAQENLKQFMDVEAIQENLKKFYDVEAIQENLKNAYDVEQFQANLQKLIDNDTLASMREYAASVADNEQAAKSVELAANLVAANTKSLTDALVLQSVQLREGVEAALKQAEAVAASNDVEAAFETQKACLEEVRDTLNDNFWMNIGLVAGAVEANTNLVKEAFDGLGSGNK